LLADSVNLVEDLQPVLGTRSMVWSPFPDVRLEGQCLVEPEEPGVQEIRHKHVFLAGVGALGSWVSVLFALSTTRDCTLTLVDMDEQVTPHNLNRQVLYTENDIGSAKVQAAERRLRALNPHNAIQAVCAEVDRAIIDAAVAGEVESFAEFQEKPEFREFRLGSRLERVRRDPRPFLAGSVLQADAVASCLDNLVSRYLLNALCQAADVPLINAAAQDFEGRAERIDPRRQDPCLVCRLGEKVKIEQARARCTEEGEVPVQSIVTTSAITASVQSILLLLSLAGMDEATINWFALDARQNQLRGERSRPRWPDECPAHLLPAELRDLSLVPVAPV
jgi:adenylyltransferase/sulfurtransferase